MVQHYTNQNSDGIRKSAPEPQPSSVSPRTTSIVNQNLPEKIEWEAFEHEHREHSPDWFWIVWIVALAVAIASLLFSNFLFSAIVIVSAILMTNLASEHPRLSRFTVSHRGIKVDRTLYPFTTLDGFAIKDDPEEHDDRFLLVKSKHMLAPLLIIPLAEDVPTRELRDFLLEELHEKDLHIPFSERVMELVGF